MKREKVVFLTGTRADYGKLKPLMRACEEEETIECFVYAIGMHLLPEYGSTVNEIRLDGYEHLCTPPRYTYHGRMDLDLAETIVEFSAFVTQTRPDLIVVHGDRIEPLAGAIVGVLNNTRIAHIEGGEVTGTADEFMRHAITKLSNLHFVANEEARYRLLQLGERPETIYSIGSPDIDVMLSGQLPAVEDVKRRFAIPFERYAILAYHPVTTSTRQGWEAEQVVRAVERSERSYVVILPNNDSGSDAVRAALERLRGNERFRIFPSLPFESYLSLLRHADFIIGNSSAGVREACVYGVPAIDVGTRQSRRYHPGALRNIQRCDEDVEQLLRCIGEVDKHRIVSRYFGDGHSAERFLNAIRSVDTVQFQKRFIETTETSAAIDRYINEVCF